MPGRLARAVIGAVWLVCCWPAHAYSAEAAASPLPAQGTVQAAFSPWDDVEALIIGALAEARHTILMQAYLLTSSKIVAALQQAHQRGVDVKILLDARQAKAMAVAQKQLLALRNGGVPVWGETIYTNAHNKIIIIDAAAPVPTLITGSYNFTWSAQHKNAENVLIVRGDVDLAARYADNWERHRRDAVAYD